MDLNRTVLRLDLYPARASVVGTSYSGVRAILTETELQLWRLGATGPEMVNSWPVVGEVTGKLSIGYDVPTQVGSIRVESGGGCGCGSKLANADLFPGSQVVMVGMR